MQISNVWKHWITTVVGFIIGCLVGIPGLENLILTGNWTAIIFDWKRALIGGTVAAILAFLKDPKFLQWGNPNIPEPPKAG